jgi:hypothetical protein
VNPIRAEEEEKVFVQLKSLKTEKVEQSSAVREDKCQAKTRAQTSAAQ